MSRSLLHKFDTLQTIPVCFLFLMTVRSIDPLWPQHIKSSVLIAHALDDWDIPHTHSDVLFNAFLKPHLPTIPLLPMTLPIPAETWDQYETQRQAHFARREELVAHTDLRNFGTLDEFQKEGRKILLVKSQAGNHDLVGIQEGLQDIIRKAFRLFDLTSSID